MTETISGSDDIAHASVQAQRQLDDAKMFLKTGDLTKAQDRCRELLSEDAEYVGALYVLGRAYMAGEDYEAALPCFVRASMLSPHNPSVLLRLGEVSLHLGHTEKAIGFLNEAIELELEDEHTADAFFALGRAFELQCDYEKAAGFFEEALAQDADDGLAAYFLGVCREEMNQYDAATAAYSQALNGSLRSDEKALVQYCMSRIPTMKYGKAFFKTLDELQKEEPATGSADEDAFFIARIATARGLALDRSGKHEEAWACLVEANKALDAYYRQGHQISDSLGEEAIERASGWKFAGQASSPFGAFDVPVSLFIIGPSRSGKSTLERLAGAMNGVKRGFENEIVQAAAAQTSSASGLLGLEYPGQLPSALHGLFTQLYSDEILRRTSGEKLFTITHPGLVLDAGRIAETVPNARFIFIERDHDDTAFRIFCKVYLKDTNVHAYDVRKIYDFLTRYQRLMDAWHTHLASISIRTSYEDMIADPAKVLGEVAALCGLSAPKGKLPNPGDDQGCSKPYLEYLKSARPVEGKWQI